MVMRISFDAAFDAEFSRLNLFLRRRVGAATADDLSAETFAIAYARWERFDQARPVRPWLYGIASNLVLRHWRDERRMLRAYARTGVDPVVAEDAAEASRVDAADAYRTIAADIAALRPRDREILLLHAWADLSDREIADALNLPIGTVKSRLHRMRERLRNRVAPSGQPEGTPLLATTTEEER
jgi:RNA polymerase sigma factor (sigma-70 family)